MQYAQDITSLILLAPYLGNVTVVEEISGAKGARNWQPGVIGEGDYQRHLWHWLKGYNARNPDLPRLYLGYGLQDKFGRAEEPAVRCHAYNRPGICR